MTEVRDHWIPPQGPRLGINGFRLLGRDGWGSMDPAPSAMGHATVRGHWTPLRQQWVVFSVLPVPGKAL